MLIHDLLQISIQDKEWLNTLEVIDDSYFGMMTLRNAGRSICYFQKIHVSGEVPDRYPYNGIGFIFIPGVILTREDFELIIKMSEIHNRISPWIIRQYFKQKEK